MLCVLIYNYHYSHDCWSNIMNAKSFEFKHLIDATEQTSLKLTPAQETVRQSLLAKLKKASCQWEGLHENSDEAMRHPAMGLISVSHVSSDEPRYLFSSDVRALNYVKITVCAASIKKATGEIIKGDVLCEFLMTETQFGEMIVNPNSSATPATLERLFFDQKLTYNAAYDLTKKNMGILHSNASSGSGQIDYFFDRIKKIAEAGESSGKLSVKDIAEICRNLELINGNMASNSSHSINLIGEAISSRVEEATLNVSIHTNKKIKNLGVGHED